MEARAVTCFNTGNMILKDTNPHQFRFRDTGDGWCLERACDGKDSYDHVRFECKIRYVDSGEPVKEYTNKTICSYKWLVTQSCHADTQHLTKVLIDIY